MSVRRRTDAGESGGLALVAGVRRLDLRLGHCLEKVADPLAERDLVGEREVVADGVVVAPAATLPR